ELYSGIVAHTWNQGSVVGAETVGQLALVNIARGQRILAELLLLGASLGLVDRSAGQLVGFEGTKLELGIEVETRWAGLRPGTPVTAQIELATAGRVGEETV